jgi:hypothetical protein
MIDILLYINGMLAAVVLIVAFSLCVYIVLHNWRQATARALCVLLLSVVVVYGGDVLIGRASRSETIQVLLRLQWLGIALVPAAYFHLARALAAANDLTAAPRRWPVVLGYIGSGLFFVMALYTDLVVAGGIPSGVVAQFRAGPLFWAYTLLFGGSMLLLLATIIRARRHALTPALRRRIGYLAVTFAAPGLGVFPYLVLNQGYTALPQSVILLASAAVSMGVVVMSVVMAYSIAFQGMLLPDRLIKYDFTRWWLYGPMVGVTIVLCLQIVPGLEQVVGLPSGTLIPFAVMIMTVLMPMLISRLRPYADALIHRQDQGEIDYLRNLPRNTFTRTDLRQLLENTLIAVCGALHAETGFVAGPSREGYTVKALCGSRREVKRFVSEHPLNDVMTQVSAQPTRTDAIQTLDTAFQLCDGFRLLPLRSPEGTFLGALGVAQAGSAAASNGALTPETRHLIGVLAHQIELALTTVEMQQRIFDMLRGMRPDVQSLQQLSTRLEQATPAALATLESNDVSLQPQFPQVVKDALTHYWGGPKLSDSPLLELRTVRRLLQQGQEPGGSPTRALQSVLRQAINNLRPDEQLDPSAQEWLLYNILDMRFLQGKRIRDVADRLAMSESDFYRKQRIAVEEVARQLALMEDGEKIVTRPDVRTE